MLPYRVVKKAITSFEVPNACDIHKDTSVVPAFDSGHYVFDIDVTCTKSHFFSSVSDKSIILYDSSTLSKSFAVSGHNDRINSIEASKFCPSLLYSGSSDNTVCIWDTRVGTNPVSRIRFSDEVMSLSVGLVDTLLAVGVDSSIIFNDLRFINASASDDNNCRSSTCKSNFDLGEYNDTHTDMITQIKFKDANSSILASSSEDGLICVYDTSVMEGEEAIQAILNTECPVRRFGFFGHGNEGIYCISTIENASFWHYPSAIRIGNFPDVRQLCEVDYLVDCLYDYTSDALVLLCGDYNGSAKMVRVEPTKLEVLSSLENGHQATVRCVTKINNAIITGGEDAAICLWELSSSIDDDITIGNNSNSDKINNIDGFHEANRKYSSESTSDRQNRRCKPY